MNAIEFAPPPYPLNAFPHLLRNTACELLKNVQTPDAMVGMGLIAVTATVCQGVADVRLPDGRKRPTSLNLLSTGQSGDRVTGLDEQAFRGIYEYDRSSMIAHRDALERYAAASESWNAEHKGLLRRITSAARQGEPMEALKEQLATHISAKPEKPRLRRIIRQDLTARALMDALEGDGESIAISTDEGHVMFRSELMSHLGLLNKTFDGAPLLTLDRAGRDNVLVANPRVTIFIRAQRVVLRSYLEKHGGLARESGHWARYLVGCPASVQGYRYVNPSELKWEWVPRFHLRVTQLLDRYGSMVATAAVGRDVIEFSEDAKIRWFELAQQTEWQLRPGEYLSDVSDFASKVMELLARLAALFQIFEGEEGRISLETLERAISVVQWHVSAFKSLFAQASSWAQDQVDASVIAQYLKWHVWGRNGSSSFIAKNHLLRNGPVRSRDRLNAALEILRNNGAITIAASPKNRQLFITLNDAYFARL